MIFGSSWLGKIRISACDAIIFDMQLNEPDMMSCGFRYQFLLAKKKKKERKNNSRPEKEI